MVVPVIENEINNFFDLYDHNSNDDMQEFDGFVPYVSIDSEINECTQICEPSREICES